MRSISHQSHPMDKRTIQNFTPIGSNSFLLFPIFQIQLPNIHTNNQFNTRSSSRIKKQREKQGTEISTTMAATMATSMAMLKPKCINSAAKNANPAKPTKQISLLSVKGLSAAQQPQQSTAAVTGTAVAGAIFSSLSAANPAFAAQQLAEIADGDNRGIALLIPLVPAVLWVLYNILQPALNQINRMRSSKGVIIGLGLGGLAASGFLHPAEASAGEIAAVAEAAASDNRGQLLLFVVAPAIAWVLYNILQPALNQINRMRSD